MKKTLDKEKGTWYNNQALEKRVEKKRIKKSLKIASWKLNNGTRRQREVPVILERETQGSGSSNHFKNNELQVSEEDEQDFKYSLIRDS